MPKDYGVEDPEGQRLTCGSHYPGTAFFWQFTDSQILQGIYYGLHLPRGGKILIKPQLLIKHYLYV